MMVKIPHSMPISLQPIDKEGRALQVMRSWLAAQPGERVSCVGCHEPSSASPNPRPSMAALKAPRVLEPWSKVDKPYPYKGDDGRNDVSAKGKTVVRGACSWYDRPKTATPPTDSPTSLSRKSITSGSAL